MSAIKAHECIWVYHEITTKNSNTHPPLKYILDFLLASSKSLFTLSAPPVGPPAIIAYSNPKINKFEKNMSAVTVKKPYGCGGK